MDSVNKSIKIKDFKIGDEVIVRGVDLNYLELIRLPKQKEYKNSFNGKIYKRWSSSKCKRINSIWGHGEKDKDVYFDFSHKSVWLVKRIGINK
tara:strand:- start:340 stop:618 length:279 start_codon:yes stop_codon:yes gene_type:complete